MKRFEIFSGPGPDKIKKIFSSTITKKCPGKMISFRIGPVDHALFSANYIGVAVVGIEIKWDSWRQMRNFPVFIFAQIFLKSNFSSNCF